MHVYYTNLALKPITDHFKGDDYLHKCITRRRLDPRVQVFRTSIAMNTFVYTGTLLWSKWHKDCCDIDNTKEIQDIFPGGNINSNI